MATENPRVWFKSISLENVRSFGSKQTINFTDKNGNAARWNVILGDNGTGKTTVLRSIITFFSGFGTSNYSYPIIANDYFLRQEGLKPILELLFQHDDNSIGQQSLTIEFMLIIGDSGNIYVNQLRNYNKVHYENFPLFGYGAARKISLTSLTNEINDRIGSLIYDQADLLNAEEWIVQADYLAFKDESLRGRFDTIIEILLKLLRDEVSEINITVTSGAPKVFFKTHYGDVRLHELSLGYKTLIAWMVDFAKGLLDRYPDSKNPLAEPAVCLVDEIDLHLHPKFQRNIIQFLTETFPNTQFIVTAHSPLIVQSAEDANIILLKREGDETHVADGIDVHSWRIDQILSSDLFGGIGGRSPKIEERMARRRALLRKDERTPDEIRELEELESELNELPVMETREALKAIDIISKAVISEK